MITREEILAALSRVIDPELRRPVTELDMVRDVSIDGSEVAVTIALTVVGCPLRSSFEDQVAQHVGTLPSVSKVTLRFDVMSPDERAALTTKLRGDVETKGIKISPRTRVLAVASGRAASASRRSPSISRRRSRSRGTRSGSSTPTSTAIPSRTCSASSRSRSSSTR